jgi:hypothetical protein
MADLGFRVKELKRTELIETLDQLGKIEIYKNKIYSVISNQSSLIFAEFSSLGKNEAEERKEQLSNLAKLLGNLQEMTAQVANQLKKLHDFTSSTFISNFVQDYKKEMSELIRINEIRTNLLYFSKLKEFNESHISISTALMNESTTILNELINFSAQHKLLLNASVKEAESPFTKVKK